MKRIVFSALSVLAILATGACSKFESEKVVKTINSEVVYVNPLAKSCSPMTKSGGETIKAYFYIRIDGSTPKPEVGTYNSNDYFPQKSTGGTMFSTYNMGSVYVDMPYQDGTTKVPKYIYDPTGVATARAIADAPSIQDLIMADKSVKGFSAIETEGLKIIWYAVKYSSADKLWHVDGVLTYADTESAEDIEDMGIADQYKDYIPSTPGSTGGVEFDVHLQEHKDWKEIKTSIHIRDTVSCRIVLPIPEDIQAPADDMVIRGGEAYEYIAKKIEIAGDEYTINFVVEHAPEGIIITVDTADQAAALAAARKAYADGLTFEVHTYAKYEVSNNQLWALLKQTKCLRTTVNDEFSNPQATYVSGQVTTAFSDERIEHEQFPGQAE